METHMCTKFSERPFQFEYEGNLYQGNGYQCTECNEFYTADKLQEMALERQQTSNIVVQETPSDELNSENITKPQLSEVDNVTSQQNVGMSSDVHILQQTESNDEAQQYLNKPTTEKESEQIKTNFQSFDTNHFVKDQSGSKSDHEKEVTTESDSYQLDTSITFIEKDNVTLSKENNAMDLSTTKNVVNDKEDTDEESKITSHMQDQQNEIDANEINADLNSVDEDSGVSCNIDKFRSDGFNQYTENNSDKSINGIEYEFHTSEKNLEIPENISGRDNTDEISSISKFVISNVVTNSEFFDDAISNSKKVTGTNYTSSTSKRKPSVELTQEPESSPSQSSSEHAEKSSSISPVQNKDSCPKRIKLHSSLQQPQEPCVICAKKGAQFFAPNQPALLEHLKTAHNAKVVLASKLNLPQKTPTYSNATKVPMKIKSEPIASGPMLSEGSIQDQFHEVRNLCGSMQHDLSGDGPRLEVVEEVVECTSNVQREHSPYQTKSLQLEEEPMSPLPPDELDLKETAHVKITPILGNSGTNLEQVDKITPPNSTLIINNAKATTQAVKKSSPFSKLTTSKSLKEAQIEMERNIISISCLRCNRTYSATQETNLGVLQCVYCRWTFQSAVHLRCHMDHFHSNDTKCPLCPYVLKTGGVTAMDQHYKKQHPTAKIFHCYLCEMEFTRKACLHGHMQRHFKRVGDYECPHCHMRFEQESRVNVHVVRCHAILLGYPKVGDVESNDKTTYMCGICGRQYTYAGSLHLHLKKHKMETESQERIEGSVQKLLPAIRTSAKLQVPSAVQLQFSEQGSKHRIRERKSINPVSQANTEKEIVLATEVSSELPFQNEVHENDDQQNEIKFKLSVHSDPGKIHFEIQTHDEQDQDNSLKLCGNSIGRVAVKQLKQYLNTTEKT